METPESQWYKEQARIALVAQCKTHCRDEVQNNQGQECAQVQPIVTLCGKDSLPAACSGLQDLAVVAIRVAYPNTELSAAHTTTTCGTRHTALFWLCTTCYPLWPSTVLRPWQTLPYPSPRCEPIAAASGSHESISRMRNKADMTYTCLAALATCMNRTRAAPKHKDIQPSACQPNCTAVCGQNNWRKV